MLFALQILTVILISLALALALAHALELPGKMRLTKEIYFATQPICYPGFTIGGGIGEAGGIVATILLLLFMPFRGAPFWLTFVALLGLVAMQAVFWLVTQPVNRYWLKGEKLGAFSSRFFSLGTQRSSLDPSRPLSWTQLRDRWEYSHVARAGFALVSLVAIVVATASTR
jgi:hypothetical protein